MNILVETGAIKYGNFELASGRSSSYFVDVPITVLTTDGAREIIPALYGKIILGLSDKPDSDPIYICGVGSGGALLVAQLALYLSDRPYAPQIHCFYLQKLGQDWSDVEWVGNDPPHGAQVVVVDDVVTTGGSAIRVAEILRSVGYQVPLVACVVDRDEGGKLALDAAGCDLVSVFQMTNPVFPET